MADRAALTGEAEVPGTPSGDGDGLVCPLVLVVEDHAEVRAYLRELLAPRYRVLEAKDGAERLSVARAEQPDLVLSDVMMPGTDGFALLDALREDERLRQIPVLLLTARASEADRVEGLTRGADGYLVKPFSAEELQARVGGLIQTRQALQERYRKELRVEPTGVVVASARRPSSARCWRRSRLNSQRGVRSRGSAEHVGLSRRQLTRKLKAVAGEPPSDLLRRLRLERAAQLLKAGAETVAEGPTPWVSSRTATSRMPSESTSSAHSPRTSTTRSSRLRPLFPGSRRERSTARSERAVVQRTIRVSKRTCPLDDSVCPEREGSNE